MYCVYVWSELRKRDNLTNYNIRDYSRRRPLSLFSVYPWIADNYSIPD
jgi:hypothetical protein